MPALSRRSLLAGAGSALSLAAAAAESSGSPLLKLPKKVRIAMVGFDGHTAEILDPLPGLPDVELAAVCASDAEIRQRARGNKFIAGAKAYSSLTQMLDNERGLDIVAVCNQNGERASAVLQVAQRGLHVIAEKPLAINRGDYQQVKQTVIQKKTGISLLLPMRFDPQFAALKKIVDDGVIGEVIQVSSQKSYKSGSPGWRRKRESYGSTILWIGIHMIDLMRWSSGREFLDATGWQHRVAFPELADQENVSACVFHLDNSGLAILRMDYLRPDTAPTHGDDRLRLAGTKGVAEYLMGTGVTLVTTKDKPHVIEPAPVTDGVLVDFLRGTYLGGKRNITVDDVWRVNEITLAAHESAEKGGQTVRLGNRA